MASAAHFDSHLLHMRQLLQPNAVLVVMEVCELFADCC